MSSLIVLKPLPANERRRWPRFLVSPVTPLVVGVAILDAKGKPHTFTGRVRDLSEAGLSIVLPPDEECGQVADYGHELTAVISVSQGAITARGAAVYCHLITEGVAGSGYVVGMRFTEVSEGDRRRLAEFLKEVLS